MEHQDESRPPDRSGAPASPAAEPLRDTRLTLEAARPQGGPAKADWEAFQAALLSLTPKTYVTRSLLACNLAVFALMVIFGASPLEPTSQSLISWGADYGPLTSHGQWWRLWTSNFVHIGFVHLICNLLALWQVGDLVERLLGNVGFLVLYTLSGIVGSLASLYWNPVVLSAGASGAIFGVYGALFACLFENPGVFPGAILSHLLRTTFLFVGYNLVYGLRVNGIDMAAHVGGLVAGILCGLVLARPLSHGAANGRARRIVLLGAAGSVFVVAGALFAPREVDIATVLRDIARSEWETEQILWDAFRKNGNGALPDEEFAKIIEEQVLPAWGDLRARLAKLPEGRGVQSTYAGLLDRYLAAMQDAAGLLADSARTGGTGTAEVNARLEEARRIWAEMSALRPR